MSCGNSRKEPSWCAPAGTVLCSQGPWSASINVNSIDTTLFPSRASHSTSGCPNDMLSPFAVITLGTGRH